MSKFFFEDKLIIEAKENFQKQSYRNRCEILSSNGSLSLFVPLVKGKDQKTKIKDIRIDYATEWQKQHFKSIESAYNSSPFFFFIIDDFMFVFEKKERYLFDLNIKILEQIKIYLQIDKITHLSTNYIIESDLDYRNSIHPKKKMRKDDLLFKPHVYYQTFNDRFSFIPNLSVLDLLFNEGSQAISILKRSLIHLK